MLESQVLNEPVFAEINRRDLTERISKSRRSDGDT